MLVVIDDYSYRQLRQLYIQPCPVYWEFGAEVLVIRNDKKNVAEILKDLLNIFTLLVLVIQTMLECAFDLIGAAADHGIPCLEFVLVINRLDNILVGKLFRCSQPMHGKISSFLIAVQGFFRNLLRFSVTRYHSLIGKRKFA